LTLDIPKSMIVIAGKPFLEHQINLLRKNSVLDIVLCIGYRGEKIRKYFGGGSAFGVRIKYSDDGDQLLGTGGSLKKAKDLLADRFFLTFGDSYPLIDYRGAWNRFIAGNKDALMVVLRNFDKYCPSNVAVKDGLVTKYSKKQRTPEMSYVEFGVTFLKRQSLELIPVRTPVDLEVLYSALIKMEGLAALEVEQRIYEIGSYDGLEEFRSMIESAKVDA